MEVITARHQQVWAGAVQVGNGVHIIFVTSEPYQAVLALNVVHVH
jgi:hypothetical protein